MNMNTLKLSVLACFLLFFSNNMQAQAPKAPCWFSQPPICRNSDFAYATGMGTGDPDKIRNLAEAEALKRYSAEVRGVQLPDATFREILDKGLENAQIEGRPVQYRVVRQIFENNNYYILLLLPKRFSTGTIYYPDEDLCDQRTGNFAKAEPAKTGTSSPMIGYQSPTDLEFVITKNGKFSISLETRTETFCFALYDKYGTQLMPSEPPRIRAGTYEKTAWGVKSGIFEDYYKVNRCAWSPTNIFEGSFTFILDAGTYYLRFIRSETGSSEVGLTTQFVAFR